jgi:hypothetical protein
MHTKQFGKVREYKGDNNEKAEFQFIQPRNPPDLSGQPGKDIETYSKGRDKKDADQHFMN